MLNKARASGFSLVELITVIVLIGVLSALAAPRFFERSSYDARTFTDQTLAMLRYGQKLAIAQNRPVYVRLDAGKSVALCFAAYPSNGSCSSGNQVVPPTSANSGSGVTLAQCSNQIGWFCEGVPTGLSYTSSLNLVSPNYGYFYFDAQGMPFAQADLSPTATSTFTRMLIRITGDGSNHDIYVEPETGYVHS